MEDPKNRPDFTCAAYQRMSGAWTVISDVLAGQEAVRAKTTTYLPKEPAELQDDYDRRLARSLFFEDYRDCVVNLSGMVFRKSPTLGDDVPEALKTMCENIDNAGTHLDVLLQALFEDGFYGHSFIVVDLPPKSETVMTAADEIGNRSYWCMRQAKDALNWRTAVVNGKTVVTQITFKEETKEPSGLFGETDVVRYRVYLLDENGEARWQVWREVLQVGHAEKQIIMDGDGPILTKRGQPLKRLPIAVHYGEREGLLESRPPLKGIADINLAMFQKYSDLTNIEHMTCAVTLSIAGGDDNNKDVTMGGNRVLWLPMGAKAEFLEVDGDSIPALERDLESLEKRLVAKGLDFVQDDNHVPPTATEVMLAYTTRTSKLAKMVRSIVDCAEEALDITAEMEGLDQGGSITVGVDENSLTLSWEQIRILSELNERGQLSLQTVWALMSRADQLPEDFDPEEELKRVDEAAEKQMERNAKQFDAGMESTP